jgi:hypothetical protein
MYRNRVRTNAMPINRPTHGYYPDFTKAAFCIVDLSEDVCMAS